MRAHPEKLLNVQKNERCSFDGSEWYRLDPHGVTHIDFYHPFGFVRCGHGPCGSHQKTRARICRLTERTESHAGKKVRFVEDPAEKENADGVRGNSVKIE